MVIHRVLFPAPIAVVPKKKKRESHGCHERQQLNTMLYQATRKSPQGVGGVHAFACVSIFSHGRETLTRVRR